MKKKLKLNDLKVQSFVTADAENIKGGTGETMYSCLAYVTCNVVGCVLTQYGNHCYTGNVNTNPQECIAIQS